MEEFERAILCCFDLSIPEAIRTQADRYCKEVTTQPDGWKPCLELFFRSEVAEVKFFCLTTITEWIDHRYLMISEGDKGTLKMALMKWPETLIETPNIKAMIKNKYSQVVALIFRLEYPEHWPTFFKELLSWFERNQIVLIDIFLRIMDAIDDNVVNLEFSRSTSESARNTLIKDYMRTDCIPVVVQAWYNILITYHNSNGELAKMALQNVKRYINWIDINLIANDHFVQLFFQFLKSENLREDACECLFEIVSKGMDPSSKLQLLEKLQLKAVLSGAVGVDDPEFQTKVAKLVEIMGVEAIHAVSKVAPDLTARARQLELDALQLLFVYLNHEYDDVSQATFEFAELFINQLKHEVPLSPEKTLFVKQLLQIIANKMRKIGDSSPDEFQEYCRGLSTMFKNLTRIAPELVAEFIERSFNSQIPPQDVISLEATMQLIYYMIEGLTEAQLKQFNQYFTHLIATLINSGIYSVAAPVEPIGMLFFELIIRYSRYVPDEPGVTAKILEAFFDARGIRSPSQKLRARSSYLFSRYARQSRNALVPFLPEIFKQVTDIMVLSPEVQRVYSFEEQLYLYEALSVLINGVPEVQQQNTYIQAVVSMLVQRIDEIINKELYKMDTPSNPVFTTLLCQCISATSTFTKGLGDLKEERSQPFKRAFELILLATTKVPNNEDVKSKVVVFIHRMVESLGKGIFPFLPSALSTLLQYRSLKDITDFIRLINQLMARFKEGMLPIVDRLFMELVSSIFSTFRHAENLKSVPSEESREVNELRKYYFTFLQSIVANNCVGVLTSEANAPHMNEILKTVIDGCFVDTTITGSFDLGIPKACFLTLSKLIECWGGSANGFNQFIYSQVVPASLAVVLKPGFNTNDAGAHQLMVEISKLHKLIYRKYGNEFLEFMKTFFTNSLPGCPPDLARGYLQHIVDAQPSTFQNFFKVFVTSGLGAGVAGVAGVAGAGAGAGARGGGGLVLPAQQTLS